MQAVDAVDIDLVCEGERVGWLRISIPPASGKANRDPLVVDDEPSELERVQLTEAGEYRYAVDVAGVNEVSLEPREVFYADDISGLTGRLRPGLYVGRLAIRAAISGHQAAEAVVEVRSRKLGYLSQYRNMLADIARVAAELSLQRFAATEQRVSVDANADAETLYQRYCFLESAILTDKLDHAISAIVARPFVEWKSDAEDLDLSRGVRGSSTVARAMASASVRVDWPDNWHPELSTLPAKMPCVRFEHLHDNVPNRFVRFVLEQWRSTLDEIEMLLRAEKQRAIESSRQVPAPVSRGLSQLARVQGRLDGFLDLPLFQRVGRLAAFPGANQVLQRRAGYRDVRELYALSEFAGNVTWDGGPDVFGAGQRNVAALYEYWVFLQLATVLHEVTGGRLSLSDLVKPRADGFTLGLKQERESTVKGEIIRHGTRLRLELSFNRSFESSISGGSWTRTMRPDCSLMIIPVEPHPLVEPVSLHFDAKYRVDSLEDVLGQPHLEAKADDLVKMHAYRDAILRAVGAYVIYPGDGHAPPFRKFAEIVPGLGAFPLTPGENEAVGIEALRRFIDEVLEHVATRASRRARSTFWETESHRADDTKHPRVPVWLRKPPADTTVLFGYVKNEAHLEWIVANEMYNLRADDREGSVPLDSEALRADVVVLYGYGVGGILAFLVGQNPKIMTAEDLRNLGYPNPGGRIYFCVPIRSIEAPADITVQVIRRLGARKGVTTKGAPFCATYLETIASIEA